MKEKCTRERRKIKKINNERQIEKNKIKDLKG